MFIKRKKKLQDKTPQIARTHSRTTPTKEKKGNWFGSLLLDSKIQDYT